MKTCNNCLANKVCDHNRFGFEDCNNFLGSEITSDYAATCKDCLCYDACGFHIDEETTMTVNECGTGFKSRDQYVKLPAYIGQPVWKISSKYQWVDADFKLFGYELENGKVSMIQQKADKSWKFRVTINSSVSDYTLLDVGNNIFFSETEAIEEQHRRERELTI